MESLDWSRWSVVRKTQAVAAVLGFLITVAIHQAIKVFCHGEGLICVWLITPGRIIFYPIWKFANWCGPGWKVSGIDEASPSMVVAMILFNTIVFAIFGTILGLLLKYATRSNS